MTATLRRAAPPQATKDERYREAAKSIYEEEGTLEFCDNADVSESEDGEGAYVAAWVYVNREDLNE